MIKGQHSNSAETREKKKSLDIFCLFFHLSSLLNHGSFLTAIWQLCTSCKAKHNFRNSRRGSVISRGDILARNHSVSPSKKHIFNKKILFFVMFFLFYPNRFSSGRTVNLSELHVLVGKKKKKKPPTCSWRRQEDNPAAGGAMSSSLN